MNTGRRPRLLVSFPQPGPAVHFPSSHCDLPNKEMYSNGASLATCTHVSFPKQKPVQVHIHREKGDMNWGKEQNTAFKRAPPPCSPPSTDITQRAVAMSTLNRPSLYLGALVISFLILQYAVRIKSGLKYSYIGNTTLQV